MSAIIVANVVTTQLAIQNAARARQQHIEACTSILSNGSSSQSSVQEIQSYAECVQYMYPQDVSTDVYYAKIIVAALLLGTIIGAIVGFVREPYDRTLNSIGGGLFGLAATMVLGSIVAGIMFVFS